MKSELSAKFYNSKETNDNFFGDSIVDGCQENKMKPNKMIGVKLNLHFFKSFNPLKFFLNNAFSVKIDLESPI